MLKVLSQKATATATTAGTASTLGASPFLDGEDTTLMIAFSPDIAGGTGTIVVQGSDDGTTYTTLYTSPAGVQPTVLVNIQAKKYMRAQPGVAFSAGTFSAYLLGVT